jgi:hypothetical protein
MTNAVDLLARLRDQNSKALPWMAVFDATGKRLATSDDEACRNILYPQSDADIALFGAMLAKGSLRLFAPDFEKLEESLRADREARAKRARNPAGARPSPDADDGGAPAARKPPADARPKGGAEGDGSGG